MRSLLLYFWIVAIFWLAVKLPHRSEIIDSVSAGNFKVAIRQLREDTFSLFASQEVPIAEQPQGTWIERMTQKTKDGYKTYQETVDFVALSATDPKVNAIKSGANQQPNRVSSSVVVPEPKTVTISPPGSPAFSKDVANGKKAVPTPYVTVRFRNDMVAFCPKGIVKYDLGVYVNKVGAIDFASYINSKVKTPVPQKIYNCRFKPQFRDDRPIAFFTIMRTRGVASQTKHLRHSR